ncbi:MAG TPA: APC family permease [Gemmatimonadaceae bacterium]|nr:APC family permease [Gemmatimonadaceae bacterium]
MTKRLLTILGVAFAYAAIVGNTVGAGILRAPGDIAAHLPTVTLFFAAWIAGALYALAGANALSELATMMPESGGQYHFARAALGPYAGFVVGWNDWVSTTGSTTAVALVLAESVAVLVPSLAGRESWIAAVVLMAATAALWRGVRGAAQVQYVATMLKALVFVALIVAALAFAVSHGLPSRAAVPATRAHGLALFAAFMVAMQGVIYAYDGWTGALYFSEEIRDPGRAIPRATFGGLLSVVVLYLLISVAFIAVIPIAKLAGDPLAAGSVARAVFGARGDIIVRLVIVCALPSTITAIMQMAPRVLFAMARDGLSPAWATSVNAGGTPTAAMLATLVVALLFLFTGTADAVIAVVSFFFVATYSLSFLSLFILRRREPARARPYRARGHPWTTAAAFIGSIAFLAGTVYGDPRNGLIAAGLVAISYPVYRVFAARRSPRA